MDRVKWTRCCAILGVSTDATIDEIKKQYRERARKLHPDSGSDADFELTSSGFIELSEAYNYLLAYHTTLQTAKPAPPQWAIPIALVSSFVLLVFAIQYFKPAEKSEVQAGASKVKLPMAAWADIRINPGERDCSQLDHMIELTPASPPMCVSLTGLHPDANEVVSDIRLLEPGSDCSKEFRRIGTIGTQVFCALYEAPAKAKRYAMALQQADFACAADEISVGVNRSNGKYFCMRVYKPEDGSTAVTWFNRARNLYVKGDYAACLAALDNVTELQENIVGADDVRGFCEQGVDLLRRQALLDLKTYLNELNVLAHNSRPIPEDLVRSLRSTLSIVESDAGRWKMRPYELGVERLKSGFAVHWGVDERSKTVVPMPEVTLKALEKEEMLFSRSDVDGPAIFYLQSGSYNWPGKGVFLLGSRQPSSR